MDDARGPRLDLVLGWGRVWTKIDGCRGVVTVVEPRLDLVLGWGPRHRWQLCGCYDRFLHRFVADLVLLEVDGG